MNMSSSERKRSIKLPLLPSERERIHKERLRGRDSGSETNIQSERSDDKGVIRSEGKDEKRATFAKAERNLEISDRTRNEGQVSPSAEEEERQMQGRVREYQERHFSLEPPLPVSTTSLILRDVLLSSSQFVNAFVADADGRLEESDSLISALERQMGLLEGKLSSVSEISGSSTSNVKSPDEKK